MDSARHRTHRLADHESIASDDYTYSDYSESHLSKDTLDDLLERFTLDFQPELVVKLRTRVGPLVIGGDISRAPSSIHTSKAFVVKPINRDNWWRRVRMDDSGLITVRSRKLHWWLFTLSLEGHANPFQRTSNLSFRVATKWDVSKGEYRNKKRFYMGDATEARMHWSVSYDLPEIAGSFGASGGTAHEVSRDMHADVGYAHGEISKLELVIWPLKNRPSIEEMYPEPNSKNVATPLAQSTNNNSDASSSSSTNNSAAINNKNGSATPKSAVGFSNNEKGPLHGLDNFMRQLPEKLEDFKQGIVTQLQWKQPKLAS